MRDPLNCLVDRLPGLLVGAAFALYHLPLVLSPSETLRFWLPAYTIYAGSLGRLDRLSPLLGMVALITLAFVMTLQNLDAPPSRLFRDLGWLFFSVAAGEALGCGSGEDAE